MIAFLTIFFFFLLSLLSYLSVFLILKSEIIYTYYDFVLCVYIVLCLNIVLSNILFYLFLDNKNGVICLY